MTDVMTGSLAAWGVLRPADVIATANGAGLSLAAAAALLEQESDGGHNVFGHDAVNTGGAYVKGAEVTEATYRAYRAAVAAGHAGQQGVGPCQLTSTDYQDRADQLSGCWDPVANMRVGFALLSTYARQWNLADAFRAYNGGAGNHAAGSNANADSYASSAMDKYGRWVTRLGPASTTPEVDVALSDDDVRRIVAALLTAPLLDLYPTTPNRTITVGETLQWAAANAGRALTEVKRLESKP